MKVRGVAADASDARAEGALHGLGVTGVPSKDGVVCASYELAIGDVRVALDALRARPFMLEHLGTIQCRHCGAITRRSYADGHCYPCFKRLARCDLCVVSPDRCHYHLGTCREPEWGEQFCMQPHLVYLANSAGLKVGLTRPENVPGRWLEQGATQAALIMRTQTRQQAGCVEAALARYVADKTDWRMLLRADAPELDLTKAWERLRDRAAAELDALAQRFPGALAFEPRVEPFAFRYPVSGYPAQPWRLGLDEGPVAGHLLGAKGQYLILDTGVFNVRQFTSYRVRLSTPVQLAPGIAVNQLPLF